MKVTKRKPFQPVLSRTQRRVLKFHTKSWYFHVEISILDPLRGETLFGKTFPSQASYVNVLPNYVRRQYGHDM